MFDWCWQLISTVFLTSIANESADIFSFFWCYFRCLWNWTIVNILIINWITEFLFFISEKLLLQIFYVVVLYFLQKDLCFFLIFFLDSPQMEFFALYDTFHKISYLLDLEYFSITSCEVHLIEKVGYYFAVRRSHLYNKWTLDIIQINWRPRFEMKWSSCRIESMFLEIIFILFETR